jgi:hypothetical protein
MLFPLLETIQADEATLWEKSHINTVYDKHDHECGKENPTQCLDHAPNSTGIRKCQLAPD